MTRNVTQHTTVAVCQDCLLILANGCDDCTHDLPHDCHARRMSTDEFTPGCGEVDCPRCADGGSWFSWAQACDCCGDTTAGDRYCATLWGSDPQDEAAAAHGDYPHQPGTLYDCPACESRCHCEPDSAECVFEGEHDRPTAHIPRGTQHLGSDAVWAMLAEREGRCEITDACAAAIASWWQAPRGPGEAFTRLVSHIPVTVAELHDAIAYERAQISGYGGVADRDRLALGMLATWALNGAESL